MATPWTSLTERMNQSEVSSSPGHAKELFFDLGQVLERLWIFYEAMLRGTPVANSDEVLSQIGVALRRVSTRQRGRVDARSQRSTSPGSIKSSALRVLHVAERKRSISRITRSP
jgi:hypothetical protein